MDKFNDLRDMKVNQKVSTLLLKVYELTKKASPEKKFVLTDDLRSSADSLVQNIAEKCGRYETDDKTRFYMISRGSSGEIMSQLLVARAPNYPLETESNEIISGYKEVIEELNALIYTLEK